MSQGAARRVVRLVRAAARGEAGARRAVTELWKLATVVDLDRQPATLRGRPVTAASAPRPEGTEQER
ncbi:MAG: hypothetical protein H6744_08415 [Deltaproteobacteria bacterium]|nr:hypothetical protein [Deltaproteobacteria bacterium]MCB9786700.1 hypothetical protein [Deltaproteobacteria bacterium]